MTLPKKHNKVQRKAPLYSLEKMYRNIYSGMVMDLTAPGTHERAFGLSKVTRNHRLTPKISYSGATPYLFKVWYQLDTFHKRLIFRDDPSFETLSLQTMDEFAVFQQKSQLIDPRCSEVLERARAIVHDILGEFDFDRFAKYCCFGKRAAKDLTRKQSYIDLRCKNLNGTASQLSTFDEIRARDIHLLRATRKQRKKCWRRVSVINGTTVPKSWKAARMIFPDTIVGGFLSRGLGNYMRHRLEASTHIDLSLQQERHKRWAQSASIHGHLATIDMSKASDSFMPIHMKALLPDSWLAIVDTVRCEHYELNSNQRGFLASQMLMGSGHTFPLQTILFYAYARAATDLLGERGTVSAYGDDIIVPNFAAPGVIWAFELLGFSVNTDKTFLSSDYMHIQKFRESCGGDYYNGLDVRPWMPECETRLVRKTEYVAELHKAVNGLCERWHPTEIDGTLRFLLSEIDKCCTVSFVPDTETETSGIRLWILHWIDVGFITCNFPHMVNGVYEYHCLRPRVKKRVTDGRAAYWAWLQGHRGSQPLVEGWTKSDPLEEAEKTWTSAVGTKFRREAKRGLHLRYGWTRKGE